MISLDVDLERKAAMRRGAMVAAVLLIPAMGAVGMSWLVGVPMWVGPVGVVAAVGFFAGYKGK